ncbi:MAG: SIMPL domain-containing protein [Dehalococcoidales bacterium]|jgi:hypothetical protein
MKKIWLGIIAVVVLALGVVGLAGCGSDNTVAPENLNVSVNSQQTGLWVNGEGKVSVAPDVAVITLGIEAQETAVADALAEASTAMDAVIQALHAQGIEDKDIQTQYFSINQVTNWDNNKEEITGYRVTNTLTVKVREIENAGQVIDAVVAAGGNLTRINGITFTVDEPADSYVQARDLAITHAKNKAQEMASKTGMTLGKVTYITENSGSYNISYRNYYSMEDAMAIPAPTVVTPVSVGQLEITATVQIAYEIK